MEEVVSAVCAEAVTSGSTASTPAHGTQAGKVPVEAADVAASVLIKLLIDMYVTYLIVRLHNLVGCSARPSVINICYLCMSFTPVCVN